MNIKPSRQHGSSMWIQGTTGDRWSRPNGMNDYDDLTVANACLYASPTGYNPLVGTQANHGDPADRPLNIWAEVKA